VSRITSYKRSVRPGPVALLFLLIFCSSRSWSQVPSTHVSPAPDGPTQDSKVVTAQADVKKDPEQPKDAPVDPKKQPKKEPPPPEFDLFAQAPTASGEAPVGRNLRMIGDFPSYFYARTLYLPAVQTIQTFQSVSQLVPVTQTTLVTNTVNASANVPATTVVVPVNLDGRIVNVRVNIPARTVIVPVTTTTPVANTTLVSSTSIVPLTIQAPTTVKTIVEVPDGFRGPFKIAENESSQPEDRVYFTYNYFNGLQGPSGAPFSSTSIQTATLNGQPATISTTTPGVPTPRFDLYREVLGFEKLVFDNRSSIGVRLPLVQQVQGDGSYGAANIGDVSLIFKHVLLGDVTGNLISGGLALTVPTGPAIETYAGNIRDVVLQPFVGGRYGMDRWMTQGFISLAVPTDSRDVTVLFNDFSVSYMAYRGAATDFFSFIAPTLEGHLTTPLNHLTGTNPITVPNLLSITTGVHCGIYQRTTLTLGLATPVTGPRLFNIEAMAYLNYNF
jgi:hypothetical protein